MGEIENGLLSLKKGDVFHFTNEKRLGNLDGVYLSYPNFHSDVTVSYTHLDVYKRQLYTSANLVEPAGTWIIYRALSAL